MLNDDELRYLEKAFFGIRFTWIVLLIALVVCVIIANVIGKKGTVVGTDSPPETFLFVGYILYALGAVMLGTVYFIRRSITNYKSTISRIIGFFLGACGSNPRSAFGRYLMGISICLGLIGGVALCGFCVFMINADFLSLYLLIGIAAAALFYFRPKKQELIDLATRIKQNS